MGRRRKDMWAEVFDGLSWVFTRIHPAWAIPLAGALYFGIKAWFNHTVNLAHLHPLEYLFAGVPAVFTLLAGVGGWRARLKRAELLQQKLDIDWLNSLSWREFEQRVAEVYRERGYKVDEVGGGGQDGGIDLLLKKDGMTTLVQCKCWKTTKVPVQPVRELFGVMAAEKADRAIFITSGVYTTEALRFAEGNPIELIDGAQLVEMFRQMQSSIRSKGDSIEPLTPQKTVGEIPARPTCPRCRSSMVLRQNKAAQKFWGCSSFPKCRGTREI